MTAHRHNDSGYCFAYVLRLLLHDLLLSRTCHTSWLPALERRSTFIRSHLHTSVTPHHISHIATYA
jgi:hypothetical protein